jgi:hypothetical protein
MPLSNALLQLQAQYHHCGVAASEKCLSAATFVRRRIATMCRAHTLLQPAPYTHAPLSVYGTERVLEVSLLTLDNEAEHDEENYRKQK